MGIVQKAKDVVDKAKINVEKFMLNSVKNSLIDGAIFGQIEKAEKKPFQKSDGLVSAKLLLEIGIERRKTVYSLNYVLSDKPTIENRLESTSPLTDAEIQGQMKTAQMLSKMSGASPENVSAIFISCDLCYDKQENGAWKRPKNIELVFLIVDKNRKTSKFLL